MEEIEVTWGRKGRVKRGESNLAVIDFLFAPHSLEHSREVHGVPQRREEGGRR